MNALLNDMAFEAPSRLQLWRESETGFGPAVDMYETDTEIVVRAELPGVKREDMEVNAERNSITIRGEARKEGEVEEAGYYRRELRYGTFARTVPTPSDIDPEKVSAKYSEGILTVRAPKAEPEVAGRKVDVE